jgi:purine catabolism regulator
LLSIWESVLKQVSDEKNLPEILRDRKAVARKKVNLHQSMHEGLERVVAPIIAGGVARGYLSIIDLSDQLDAVDELVAEQGAMVCAIEMSRAKAVREAEKRLKGNLLTALLQENIAPRDAVLWIQGMGLDLDKSHVAIRFSWDGSGTPSMRRLETIVNGEITRGSNKVLVEKLGSEVVCICQVDESSGRPLSALSLANAVEETAHREFPDVPLRCGIGSPAAELIYWRDSFRQAGQALDMARRLADRSPKYFPDLSVYRLLLQLERHPDLLMFKNEILAPLIAYEGGGELIRTLEVFFEHNGVLSQAAEALFIHRNTLIYRMERIEEITGLDLNDTETRLAVQLALRIHRMRPLDHNGCD